MQAESVIVYSLRMKHVLLAYLTFILEYQRRNYF